MLRRLIDRLRRRGDDSRPTGDASAPRDFAREREDRQEAGLSVEDRAWQDASLQRDHDRRGRDQTPPAT